MPERMQGYRVVMLKIFVLLMVSGLTRASFAQQTFSVKFVPVFGDNEILAEGDFFTTQEGVGIRLDVLKMYISDIELHQNGEVVWKEANSYHLLNAFEDSSLQLRFEVEQIPDFDRLVFHLGVDSATTVSGAMGGDLDPTKGMYWTWQSGYIHFKCEGRSPLCETRNHAFQFHLGGYQWPFATLQKVVLKAEKRDTLLVRFDLERWMRELDLSQENEIMSPGKKAVVLSEKLPAAFRIQEP